MEKFRNSSKNRATGDGDRLPRSPLDEGGVVFGDGIESDRVELGWGVQATIRVAPERLRLVGVGVTLAS
jgi:hypothetical protein